MSVAMYLRLDEVKGGSMNYNYKGWSDVLSWRWEMISNRDSPHPTANDKASFGKISLTKPISVDSTAIMLLYAQGKAIQSADLNVIPVVGKREAKQKYLAMRMEDVVIKSIITGGSIEEDHFKEHIVLIFKRIRFEYNLHITTAPGEEVKADSVDYQFAWDIAQNQQWQ